jgi:soluble lytic murein transglycosylase
MDPLNSMTTEIPEIEESRRSDSPDNHFAQCFGKQTMGFGKQGLRPGRQQTNRQQTNRQQTNRQQKWGLPSMRQLITGVALASLCVSAAAANPPAPSLKPAPALESTWIANADFSLLSRALDAADDDEWAQVRSLLSRISDPAAQTLVRWRLATNGNAGLGFTDLMAAAEEFRGWPDNDKIYEQLEQTITRSNMTADERIAWLLAQGPRTGDGILALADAYDSQGKRDEMLATVRDAYRTRPMSSTAVSIITSRYGSNFTPEDHYARADMFLWRGDTASANALASRLSSDRKAIVAARVALMKNAKNIDKLVNAVPAAYADDAGLLYERARWNERRGRTSEELNLLLRIKGETAPAVGREDIWGEKQSVMRRMLRERNYVTAYQLAAGHGLTTGEAFRDAEWMAGWLALTKLGDALKAENHFRVFAAGVATPISISRAQYWLGEALKSQGRLQESAAAYEAAAAYPYVFYGQLAAEKARDTKPELGTLNFTTPTPPTDEERAAFARQPAVRAAILLAETGRFGSFERFSFALDDILTTPAEHQMLFDIAAGYLEMRAAIRGAKAGLGRGLVAPDAVFPVLQLPTSPRSGSAEPAMVLALSRQESEFNHRAISSADARGLMQMIPRYAQAEARMVGMPFRQSWLTDDPQYNLRLGRGFLDDLVDDFGGSYILAAAAYNAGPSRARQWINDFGDPRGGVDPIDWIESIPFAETRNYVQRVLENTVVYRHRLTGQPVEIRLSEDLRRGRPR